MRGLEARLQRREQEAKRRKPNPDRQSSLDDHLRCLGLSELKRLFVVLSEAMKGDEASAAEALALLKRAVERRQKGWAEADSASGGAQAAAPSVRSS